MNPLVRILGGGSALLVDATFLFILGISFLFLGIITVLMVWFVWRYRKSRHPVAEEVKESVWLEVAWTLIPTVLMLAMFEAGFEGFQWMRAVPADAMTVTVSAQMWKWTFVYGNGRRSPDLVVPSDRPIKLLLHSTDVIHGFYVPAYRIKEDVVPGRENYLWFQPDTEGTFEIMCSSYCGERHSYMRANLRVMPGKEFRRWYGAKTGKRSALGARGIMEDAGCLVCHSLDGSRAPGPTLKGIWGRRETVASDGVEHAVNVDEAYIRRAIREPSADVVKGFRTIMPVEALTEEELAILVRYLRALR
ncbi:MAG: cytochrome c oxidase subunit II [Candidatus Coatesbacteria bacterium]